MSIHQIYTNSRYRNFNYLIELSESELMCIDPLANDLILKKAEALNKKIAIIVNTHEHWDHTDGNAALSKETGAEIWAHADVGKKIKNISRHISSGEKIAYQDGEIEFISTPGHTMSHLCLLGRDDKGNQKFFVSGDTLFNAGAGNCHNGGHPKELFETFEDIISCLDDGVLIYPGHDYLENNLKFTLDREPSNKQARNLLEKVAAGESFVTSLGEEREINTFLRLDEREIRDNLDLEVNAQEDTRENTFLKLRERRNKW